MPGLVPGTHVLNATVASKTWMAGTSPAMTECMDFAAIGLGHDAAPLSLGEILPGRGALGRALAGRDNSAIARRGGAPAWRTQRARISRPLVQFRLACCTKRQVCRRAAARRHRQRSCARALSPEHAVPPNRAF